MSGRAVPAALLVVALIGLLVVAGRAPWWATAGIGSGLLASALAVWRRPSAGPSADATPTLVEPAVDIVLVVDESGALAFGGPSDPRALGWQVNAFTSLRLDEFVHSSDMHRVLDAFTAVRDVPRAAATVEVRVRTSDAWRWTELTLVNGTHHRGVNGYVVHQRDIADRRTALQAQGEQEHQISSLRRAVDLVLRGADTASVAEAVASEVLTTLGAASCDVHLSADNRLELVGQAGSSRPERRPVTIGDDDIVGQCALRGHAVVERVDDRRFHELSDTAVDAVAVAVPLTLDAPGVLSVRLHGARGLRRSDTGFLATMAGVVSLAERQRDTEREAFHQRRHDRLTGLVNRSVFFEQLQRTVTRAGRRATGVAIVLIDLDNFTIVNESLGHAAGDTVLETVSERLAAALRPGDLLARFGGDEFVVLSPGIGDAQQAVVAAERLRNAVSSEARVAGHDIRITASAGVAVAGDDMSAEALLQHADMAMHDAKARGRERTAIFDASLHTEAVTRLRTEAELRAALDEGQLRVFYQPIVDLATGAATAAEALVRWAHPGRGLVTPDEFIPISESSGLIEEIGSWVIGQAAAQAASWAEEGNPLQVSVNLAARQLTDPATVDVIADALTANGLDPSLFAVELTESTLMSDRAVSFETLEGIAALGVGVAIDDFGTGYSSLSYLRTLPVDTMKIDRTFIDAMGRSGDDWAIVAAMVRLGQSLNKTVVAEGVETESQLALLQDLGCDKAQGFIFSPAVMNLEHRRGAWFPLVLDRR